MLSLTKFYNPITSTPFQKDAAYSEILPCDELKPYIRCFWVSCLSKITYNRIIIPDTCMDIIFKINNSLSRCTSSFYTIDEYPYYVSNSFESDIKETFAIRFYAWTAHLFAERNFIESKNKAFLTEEFFDSIKSKMEYIVLNTKNIKERISEIEKILIKRVNKIQINNNFMNAIFFIIKNFGNVKITDICEHIAISQRQLERIFNNNIGISPKAFSSLIRYQLLWQDILFNYNFNIYDAVEKYKYFDQSHLLNDFKKRHLMTPNQAAILAIKNR